MTAGRQVTGDSVNQRAAAIVSTFVINMREVKAFQAFLAATPNATLEALGLSNQDVADIKSAFVDLDDLRKVSENQVSAKTLPYNYMTFAQRLIGDGVI